MRNCTTDQITMVLVRHGQTKGNQEQRYIGVTDQPLTENGKEKLRTKVYPKVGQVYVSPMLRTRQTAQIIYPEHTPIIIDDLREMNFGTFEGKNVMDLENDLRYQAWIDSGGRAAFPEGESLEKFAQRVMRGFEQMMQLVTNGTVTNIAVVVHGGTIMALMSQLSGQSYFDFQVDNGCGYVCTIEPGQNDYRMTDYRRL